MNEKLPEYPKLYWPADEYSWERERANYWESRCRLAVEALDQIRSFMSNISDAEYAADNVLRAIGPLPEKQP